MEAGDATTALDTAAAMAALQARGAAQLDPVGWRHIQALARRAAGHQGPARRRLDHTLARLLAACGAQVELAATSTANAHAGHRPMHRPTGPLAGLLAHIARHTPAPANATGTANLGGRPAGPQARVELKAVRNYRSTWARLKVDHRMAQLRAQVPDQAGPLNTQRLLHEALAVMRDASPQYLQAFMAQVDALLWLDQAGGDGESRTRR